MEEPAGRRGGVWVSDAARPPWAAPGSVPPAASRPGRWRPAAAPVAGQMQVAGEPGVLGPFDNVNQGKEENGNREGALGRGCPSRPRCPHEAVVGAWRRLGRRARAPATDRAATPREQPDLSREWARFQVQPASGRCLPSPPPPL